MEISKIEGTARLGVFRPKRQGATIDCISVARKFAGAAMSGRIARRAGGRTAMNQGEQTMELSLKVYACNVVELQT
jgi:hypothetical protein